ncbi:MAG: GNAT family N-acetyltransferase [Oscillospiraceae bacterium]|nr:GNAT family N-acetyltransferase [Oscillospiraceae bacterium]
MEIRFARTQDVPDIITLLRQVGQVHHQGRPDIFREKAQKYGPSQVLALLDNPLTPIFVAAEGGRVLGYGVCQIKTYYQDPVIRDHTELYIDDLCVDEKTRGTGIGTTLYKEICRYAKAQGCSSVTLNVWCCNEAAMRFYESLGLRPQKIGMEASLEET